MPDPQGIAVDGRGNVDILQISGQVRRVDAVTGVISTVYTEPGTADNYNHSQPFPAIDHVSVAIAPSDSSHASY